MFQKSELPDRALDSDLEKGNNSAQSIAPQVLAVDDDEDNLLLIEYALELFGIPCVVARSGKEAIRISKQKIFSLIFLDILLPDMNGIQVLRWFRKHYPTQKTPVIAVTALGRFEDRNRILAAGFTDYLLKPYMLDDLSHMVKQYLND